MRIAALEIRLMRNRLTFLRLVSPHVGVFVLYSPAGPRKTPKIRQVVQLFFNTVVFATCIMSNLKKK